MSASLVSAPRNYIAYAFMVTFIAITLAALIFSDKFSFLQNKEAGKVSDKCPAKCCNSCALNLPLVLVFSAGMGVVASLLVAASQRKHRQALRSFIQSTGVHA